MPADSSGSDAQPLSERYTSGNARLKLTWILAMLSMVGPFSIDTYLPAFPTMAQSLATTDWMVQLTLTTYFAGFCALSLLHGAVSDAIGRRPVILGAMVVYALGSLGCALSPNITILLFFRFVQGMFAGAGVIVGRALVRDIFMGDEAQRQLARITVIFSIAPVVAPVFGGWLITVAPWQSIFWLLTLMAVGVSVWVYFGLPETFSPDRRLPFAVKPLAKNYWTIFRSGVFQRLAAISAFNFVGFFVYIAGVAAFLTQHLGLKTTQYAYLFIPSIAGIVAGAVTSGRLAGKMRPAGQIRLGFAVMGAASIVNVVVSLLHTPSVAWNIAPIPFYAFGFALIGPCVMVLLLDAFPGARGSVSALQMATQIAMMAAVPAVLVPLVQQKLIWFALSMVASAAIGFAFWKWYEKRYAIL